MDDNEWLALAREAMELIPMVRGFDDSMAQLRGRDRCRPVVDVDLPEGRDG